MAKNYWKADRYDDKYFIELNVSNNSVIYVNVTNSSINFQDPDSLFEFYKGFNYTSIADMENDCWWYSGAPDEKNLINFSGTHISFWGNGDNDGGTDFADNEWEYNITDCTGKEFSNGTFEVMQRMNMKGNYKTSTQWSQTGHWDTKTFGGDDNYNQTFKHQHIGYELDSWYATLGTGNRYGNEAGLNELNIQNDQQWHELEVKYKSLDYVRLAINNSQTAEAYNPGNWSNVVIRYFYSNVAQEYSVVELDWVLVRKYSKVEPDVTVQNMGDWYLLTVNNTLNNQSLVDYPVEVDGLDYELLDYNYFNGSYNCTPDWVCSGYGGCNTSDLAPCNTTIDNNGCGQAYSGDYSEFPAQACDYCSYNLNLVSLGVCDSDTGYRTDTYEDLNFATCCNVTGLPSDCAFGSNSTGGVNVSCTGNYVSSYATSDLQEVAIDGLVMFGIGIVSLAGIIGLVFVFKFARVRLK